MKMAKASEQDIDAAGDAMSVLNDISRGYYPARDGEEDEPTFFDPDDFDHLRRFYDLMNRTLDAAPGWPGRVIGGMCYVIMFDKNEIVDPNADTLELHPKLVAATKQVEALKKSLNDAATSLETISQLSGRKTYGNPPIETFMDTFMDVRGYAASRANAARQEMAAALETKGT